MTAVTGLASGAPASYRDLLTGPGPGPSLPDNPSGG